MPPGKPGFHWILLSSGKRLSFSCALSTGCMVISSKTRKLIGFMIDVLLKV
jgi:hypothetical protein